MEPCHRRVIRSSVDFLHKAQKPEGGWYGSWGICFTYATQFALESLSLVGETYETSPYARKACDFLISKQCTDGGWGESYKVSIPRSLCDAPATPDCTFPVMRTAYLGRAREYANNPDQLGGDGAHVREVPPSRAHRTRCATGDVQTTTGEWPHHLRNR